MGSPFPHHYEVSHTRTAPSHAVVEAPPRPPITGGPPPEFDGQPDQWSPEHLLLSAIGLCLLTTFDALASRASVAITSWTSRTSGVLEKTANGLRFTSFRIEVHITAPPGVAAAAEALVQRAERHCIVSNALCAPVAVETTCVPAGLAA